MYLVKSILNLFFSVVYFENGRSTSASTLAFTIASTTGVTWNMKVSQIECGATYK